MKANGVYPGGFFACDHCGCCQFMIATITSIFNFLFVNLAMIATIVAVIAITITLVYPKEFSLEIALAITIAVLRPQEFDCPCN